MRAEGTEKFGRRERGKRKGYPTQRTAILVKVAGEIGVRARGSCRCGKGVGWKGQLLEEVEMEGREWVASVGESMTDIAGL